MGRDVPSGVIYNNRYRGPQESLKLDQSYAQARYNIKKLFKKIEYLDSIKEDVMKKPQGINPIVASTTVVIECINDTIESIKNYEVRNG